MSQKTHTLVAITLSFLVSAATGPNLHAQSDGMTELVVEVSGLASRIGTVQIAVFASEEEWLVTPLRKEVVHLATTQSNPRVVFSLPPGEYAVSTIHDRNGNGEHDVNLFGKPLEPFGFSNAKSHPFSPPSWKEVVIALSSKPTTIEIELETR